MCEKLLAGQITKIMNIIHRYMEIMVYNTMSLTQCSISEQEKTNILNCTMNLSHNYTTW